MYAGKVVERAPVEALFASPKHPYTVGLLASVPSARRISGGEAPDRRRLPTIPGIVPDLRTLPPGCRFQDRCARVEEGCRESEPPLTPLGGREVACFVAVREAAA
jgi:peptide/nickel transport system ATP-binding protein